MFGATGQTGSYLVEQLADAGHEVWAARRVPPHGASLLPPDTPAGVQWRWADLADADQVADTVAEARPDVVFNLAALTTPGATWSGPGDWRVADVNATGALRILAAVEDHAPGARLVHASSSAVYRPDRYGLYGASKALAHAAMAGARSRGVQATNAVLYSHTSSRQSKAFLLPRACRVAVQFAVAGSAGQLFTVTDPGDTRDWMWAGDAAAALLVLAGLPPGDYDVASGERRTVLAAVSAVFEAAGLPADESTIALQFSGRGAWWEPPAHPGWMGVAGWRPTMPFRQLVEDMVMGEMGS